MKKFTELLAKKNPDSIVTRDGKRAKVLLFDRDSPHFPIVAIIENKHIAEFTKDGKFYLDKESTNDLLIK